MIWEKPIVECEAFPSKSDSAADTSFVLYGDLRMACLFGYKGDIRTEMFTTGIVRNVANNADVNLLTTDRVAVRWIERVGALTILPEAVTKLTTAPASV
jgi:HK97 family phage major capsid protein